MKIKKSGAVYSAIVSIGEKLRYLSKKNNEEYLFLNRGVNAVVNINLTEIIPMIDFNSANIQVYPPNNGRRELRDAINKEFFQNTVDSDDIFIVGGAMNGLKLMMEVIDIDKIYISKFYWGAYTNAMKISGVEYDFYENFEFLKNNVKELKGCGVIICDPNNPTGSKYDDEKLLDLAKFLIDNDVLVIWDSPYRRLFLDENDNFYSKLAALKKVVIVESFSKSIGLSGQRIGFLYCSDKDFKEEFKIHLLFSTNGINAFSQILVEKILTTPEGKKASENFKKITVKNIEMNINYLKRKNLLAENFYDGGIPKGIFVIVNKTFEQLLEKKIGSVALPYFTNMPKEEAVEYSRICVSVPHDKFKSFFDKF